MTNAQKASQIAQPISQMLLPPEELVDCIYAGFLRDTTGCALPSEARFNHFAAAPLCTITWLFKGDSTLVSAGGQNYPDGWPVPAIAFSGPQQYPSTGWNSGDVSALMVAFYPDAFFELTGLSAAPYRNRTVKLDDDLSADLAALGRAVMASGTPQDGWQALIAWVKQNRAAQVGDKRGLAGGYAGWTGRVLKRAAHSGLGRSVRQMERRIKQMTGQTRRELERFATLEQTFFTAIEQQKTGQLSAADVAAEAGFADQSHMGRNVRAQTGHSPVELMQRLESDEAFWCYRLIAESEGRIGQPASNHQA